MNNTKYQPLEVHPIKETRLYKKYRLAGRDYEDIVIIYLMAHTRGESTRYKIEVSKNNKDIVNKATDKKVKLMETALNNFNKELRYFKQNGYKITKETEEL